MSICFHMIDARMEAKPNHIQSSTNKRLLYLIVSTFLYDCESWSLTAKLERRNQALEMRYYRRLLNISYKDHVTNEEVRNRTQNSIGVHGVLLITGNSGDMATSQDPLACRRQFCRGRSKKNKIWEDNIKEWTEVEFGDSLRAAEYRERWKGIVSTSSVVPRRPSRLRDWDERDRERWEKTLSQFTNLCLM